MDSLAGLLIEDEVVAARGSSELSNASLGAFQGRRSFAPAKIARFNSENVNGRNHSRPPPLLGPLLSTNKPVLGSVTFETGPLINMAKIDQTLNHLFGMFLQNPAECYMRSDTFRLGYI